jgi:hypothetical protein
MARKFNDWIEAYLKYTENTEPRIMYRKWAAISGIASVLRRKCFLPWGSETFYPNMYIILVGPPAARKGTAMKPIKNLLERIGIAFAADESSRQKLINKMISVATMDNDVDGLTHLHSSITIFSTELTVFLKKKDDEILPTLCKWFDCESKFEYDTIARGLETVTNVWVNLFGATTPSNIQSNMPIEAFGSGFVSRTIFVFEENKERPIDFPTLQNEMEDDILFDLEQINMICGRFKIEEAIIAPYSKWYHDSEENPPIKEPRLATYLQRRPTHLLKLCMIFSASRSEERVIRLCDFNNASEFLSLTERKMPWVFRGVGSNPLADVQARVMRTIIETGAISMQELSRFYMDDVSSKDLWQIVSSLEFTGFCQINLAEKIVKCTRAGKTYGGNG